jgi:site-specific recombinase XerD
MAVTVADVRGWRDALLRRRRQKAATVAFKLNVLRAFFGLSGRHGDAGEESGRCQLRHSAAAPRKLMAGRALTTEEVRRILCGPDRRRPEGARDYAILLVMLRLGMRVSEVCSLKASDLHWSHGRWIVRFRVKGGRERTLPVPDEVRTAIKDYLKLDEARRRNLARRRG